MYNNGGDDRVEDRGAERVFETAHKDGLVDKWIQRAAEAAPFCGKSRPACGGRSGDYQDLEIRSTRIQAPKGWRQHIRCRRPVAFVCLPIAGVLAEGAGK